MIRTEAVIDLLLDFFHAVFDNTIRHHRQILKRPNFLMAEMKKLLFEFEALARRLSVLQPQEQTMSIRPFID
jgi:hypothetical protein